MKIKFYNDEGGYAPIKAHSTDAGFDLRTPEDVYIPANGTVNVNTLTHVNIPEGHVGYLMSKSGLMCKFGIMSGMGVIDSFYSGSIVACLYNVTNKSYYFKKGDKLTQLVIAPIDEVELVEDSNFEEGERGENGFGSSGK